MKITELKIGDVVKKKGWDDLYIIKGFCEDKINGLNIYINENSKNFVIINLDKNYVKNSLDLK